MGCLISAVRWIILLAIGAGIGAGVGFAVAGSTGLIVGGIAGLVLSQAAQATLIPGPKYPGDTNY